MGPVPSNVFMNAIVDLTMERFFSDPLYGGNKDMIGWKLVGFPRDYKTVVIQNAAAPTSPPVIQAPTTATVTADTATSIAGVSIAESGSAAGETFTVTVNPHAS